MHKTLDEYAKEDGYKNENGFWYESAESLLQEGILDRGGNNGTS